MQTVQTVQTVHESTEESRNVQTMCETDGNVKEEVNKQQPRRLSVNVRHGKQIRRRGIKEAEGMKLTTEQTANLKHALVHLEANKIHIEGYTHSAWYCGNKAQFRARHNKAIEWIKGVIGGTQGGLNDGR